MEIQYIKDDNGQIAFAVVPIAIWENTISQVNENAVTYSKVEAKKPFNPADYLGIMNCPVGFLDSELKNMREEWDNI
jgi:hypothetical protein